MNDYLQRIESLVDKVEDWGHLPAEPLVSVWMITFNHESYIRESIDGVLMQQVDFPYEIVIGEDKSTDRTREIVCEYQKTHPDKIRLRLARENIYSQKLKPGVGVLNACRGKYIALCEGDDYWTDPLKLQKQVDILEANPDCVLCGHRVKIETPDGSLVDDFLTEAKRNSLNGSGIYSIDDLLRTGNFIHTPSVVFRNVITKFLPEFLQSPVGDYFLYVLLAQNGNIHLMDDVMAVYRYGVGVHSRLSAVDNARKTLEYHLCILSYLQVEEQRLLFLKKTKNCVAALTKALLDENTNNVFLSKRKSFKDVVFIFGLKIYRRLPTFCRHAALKR